MQVLNTAAAGMFAAADRFNASAQRAVAWGAEQIRGEQPVDLVKETVDQVSAKTDFKANAAVIRTVDEMTGALLDMIA